MHVKMETRKMVEANTAESSEQRHATQWVAELNAGYTMLAKRNA
jgi:hypothetical protein